MAAAVEAGVDGRTYALRRAPAVALVVAVWAVSAWHGPYLGEALQALARGPSCT